jgi:cobalt-zinc-cadmium efflux system membrane fusion protein
VAVESGIEASVAGPREILSATRVLGRVVPSEHRVAHVIPRYSGIVRDGRKHIGDKVEKNEVVAIVESNQSLQPFEVRSQISGTVLQGHVVVGEFVPENQWIYVIGDLSEVWVDFAVPLLGESALAEGQTVIVSPSSVKTTTRRDAGEDGLRREAKISYIAPYADEHTQSRLLRVVMQNKDLTFLPGMHVEGEVVTQRHQAPVAIHAGALQRIEDTSVVFVKHGERYEGRPVTVGRNQGEWVEIVSGLQAGEHYVSKNSFLIKSDILKASAEHDH